jgi:hypothetical protein
MSILIESLDREDRFVKGEIIDLEIDSPSKSINFSRSTVASSTSSPCSTPELELSPVKKSARVYTLVLENNLVVYKPTKAYKTLNWLKRNLKKGSFFSCVVTLLTDCVGAGKNYEIS